jgi:hypothetical protein
VDPRNGITTILSIVQGYSEDNHNKARSYDYFSIAPQRTCIIIIISIPILYKKYQKNNNGRSEYYYCAVG